MDNLEQIKIFILELDKKISNALTSIDGKFELIHQDLTSKDTQKSEDIAYLKSRITQNERDILNLNTENTKLKSSLATVKGIGGFVAFIMGMLSFALKFLI